MDRKMEFPTEWAIPCSDEDHGPQDPSIVGSTPPQHPPAEAPATPEERSRQRQADAAAYGGHRSAGTPPSGSHPARRAVLPALRLAGWSDPPRCQPAPSPDWMPQRAWLALPP